MGNTSISEKLFEYEFIKEWGISWKEYMDTPSIVIEEMLLYFQAKERGTQRYDAIKRNKDKIKKLRNGNRA